MAQENGTNDSSGSSSTGTWVLIAVVAIVALGVILWIMNRNGSDDGSASPNPAEVATAPVVDLPTPAPSQSTPPPSGVPQAVISGPGQATVGESVTFGAENSVAVTGTQITEGQWNLGDGTQATGGTVTHIYQTAGSYNVDLTVTDSAGQTGGATQRIDVVADVPTPEAVQLPAEGQAANSAEGTITFLSDSLQGEMTASGVPYDKDAMVAAHKDLPLGTVVTVTNLFNGKSVVVEVVDRLPPTVTALIDVSSAAARELDMTESGMVDGRIDR